MPLTNTDPSHSMCQNSCPFPVAYIDPKKLVRYKVVCSVSKFVMFLEWWISTPSPNPMAGVPPFVRHLQLVTQHTGTSPPYLEDLSGNCNLSTHLAMVTGTHTLWTDEYKYSKLFLVCSCCCCETLMKLNNMFTLGYVIFVLLAPYSVGIYQAVNPNNAVSHSERPESPPTPLWQPHSLYRVSYIEIH